MRNLLFAFCLVACDGRIADPLGGAGGGPGGGAGSGTPGAPGSGAAGGALECTEPTAGPAPLRRLTRAEQHRTLQALFGDVGDPTALFPPDEHAGPFESNVTSAVSEVAVELYGDAAHAVASLAADRFDEIVGCDSAVDGEVTCAREAVRALGRRIFRRALSEDEVARYDALYDAQVSIGGHIDAVRLVVETMLQSPFFLYHVEQTATEGGEGIARLDGWSIASRLSFFLWRAGPDDALLDAAERGELGDPDALRREARRMLDDPRALETLVDFHSQWLGVRELDAIDNDELTEELRTEMRAAVEGYVRSALTGDGTIDALLTTELLTQRAVMSVHFSPVLRGKMVRELLLCQAIPPPPADVDTALPPPDPSVSPRERWSQHVVDPSCGGCHRLLDPVGFAFDHYDELGRWRDAYGGFPVDATGDLVATRDADGPFDGADELVARLAGSDEVRECVARQWVRFAVGRTLEREDECLVAEAYERFRDSGWDVRELVLAIAESERFVNVRVSP